MDEQYTKQDQSWGDVAWKCRGRWKRGMMQRFCKSQSQNFKMHVRPTGLICQQGLVEHMEMCDSLKLTLTVDICCCRLHILCWERDSKGARLVSNYS